MQPNNNLVFYLAEDERAEPPVAEPVSSSPRAQAAPHAQAASQHAQQYMPFEMAIAKVDETTIDESAHSEAPPTYSFIDELDESPAQADFAEPSAPQSTVTVKDAHDEVDWIATLEHLREKRHQHGSQASQRVKQPFASHAEQTSLASVLKVHTVTTTQLFEPAAAAIAAGKDLEHVNHSMQEARQTAQIRSASSLQDAAPTQSNHTADSTANTDLEDNDSFSPFTANLKARAKQIPMEELPVEAVAPIAHAASESGLLAKAHDVAEKTALSSEERRQILDGFLDLWQQKRQANVTDDAERQVMLREEWLATNEALLQSSISVQGSEAEQVMWLKTAPETELNQAELQDAEPVEIAVTSDAPEGVGEQAMYAPIHVHIALPQVHEHAPISVISEQRLLEELTTRLKPYFVNMLAGMVKTELNKHTNELVNQLQRSVEAEIPLMVDDVLQENLQQVLRDIKTSHLDGE